MSKKTQFKNYQNDYIYRLDKIVSNQNKLSQEHKDINSTLKLMIDNNKNSNPFIAIFENKGKKRTGYILNFVITTVIMLLLFYVEFYFWLYRDMNGLDRTFEIFGNGLFWIIAVIVYWAVSRTIMYFQNRKVVDCNATKWKDSTK